MELLQDIASTVFLGLNYEKDYEARDNIEKSVSELLPFKDVVNIQDSNIKVELFHGGLESGQLSKIKSILNKTFEVCTQHNFTPCTAEDIGVRAFLFDDQKQYVSLIESIYGIDESDSSGITKDNSISDHQNLASANIYFYQDFDDSSNLYNFTEDFYFVLAHEFFHSIYNVALCNSLVNLDFYPAMKEGLASVFAWQSLSDLGYYNKSLDISVGANIIQDNQLSLHDIVFKMKPIVDDNAHRVGEAAAYFMLNKHPELINNMFNYYLRPLDDGLQSTDVIAIFKKFYDRVYDISESIEFSNWISHHYENI